MSNDTVSLFLAMLAVVGLVFVAATAVFALVARTRGLGPGAASLRDGVSDAALPLAFAVATTCTLGSLYMSEVRHFTPCDLCWYQRICMYPLVVVLGIAALRRDRGIWRYVLPIALIGAAISTYHYLHERFPDAVATSCSLEASCSTLWIWELHFLSIPGMAWVGFVLIATLVLVARSAERRSRSGGAVAGRAGRTDDPSPQEVPA
ncbi:disulfide bond formation protein B [Dermatobacter hominis]|uniref:disulfide bond formation protein B n=1 Tax=Dermatobacter hominis TaxID=2884263 RepID=UPI001D11D34F|nr:disulfide bond formation protein B [Dermatobacter hominis]UDY35431.1 disulfide bond formation protein B [Dermatobacter hominis]